MTIHKSVLTLDDLARLSIDELGDLYAAGEVPASLAALNGAALGRVLRVRYVDQPVLWSVLQHLFASRHFPWRGKSFDTRARKSGKGDNRLRLFREFRLFSFRTRIGTSSLDGSECVVLDYDSASNPRPVRQVRDELREVSPGIYLGPALWKRQKKDSLLLLWFALDTRTVR